MFSDEQKKRLAAPLDPSRVHRLEKNGKPVLRNGKPVGYVEAWDDIEQANHIFGFDGWSRETVIVEAIHEPKERKNDQGEILDMVASYWAKVRITVLAEGRTIVREGCGAATAYQRTVGEAVENAIKGAESDATKRAFVTFGNQFGLALYDKSYKNVRRAEPEGRPAAIDEGFTDAVVETAPPMPSSSRALARLDARSERPADMSHRAGNGATRPNGGMRY